MYSTLEHGGIASALSLFDTASANLPHSRIFATGEDPNAPPLSFPSYKYAGACVNFPAPPFSLTLRYDAMVDKEQENK